MAAYRPMGSSAQASRLRLLESGLESARDAVIVADALGRIVHANRQAGRLFGLPPRELTSIEAGRRLRRAGAFGPVAEPDLPWVRVMRSGIAEAGIEYTVECSKGKPVAVAVDASPVVDAGATVGATARFCETHTRWACSRIPEIVRGFLDGAADCVFVHQGGRVRYINHAGAALLGYDEAEDLIDRPVLDFVHPDDRAEVAARIRSMLEDAAVAVLREERLLRRDGQTLWAAITAFPWVGERGTVVVGVAHDITARRAAEAERDHLLRAQEAQRRLLTSIVELAPVGIGLLRGPDLVFEIVNPALQALAPGFPLAGKAFAEVAPEMPWIRAQLERVLETGEPWHASDVAIRIQRSPGGPLEDAYFSYACARVRLSAQEPGAVLGVVIETTETARARERIATLAEAHRRSAAECAAVLDHIVEAVVAIGPGGELRILNQSARHLFDALGAPTDRIDPRSVEALQPRDRHERRLAYDQMPFARALAGETATNEEIVLRCRDGHRDVHVRVSAAPIRAEGDRVGGAVMVLADVSETAELERIEDEFIHMAAHELKTPVTVVKGYALHLLRSAAGLPPEQRRALEAIDRGAERIDRIVRDFLDVSMSELGRLKLRRDRIRLDQLAAETTARAAAASTRHRIELTVTGPACVEGDRERLEQVLGRLLDNAVRYSPSGGAVEVRVATERGSAVVTITDHGVGIAPRAQGAMFERFHRPHAGTAYDYGGLGIGLYLCKYIVEAHGGEIGFESVEGRGSTFHFTLPLAP